MAMRIKARAIRRCGELLKTVPPAKWGRTDLEEPRGTAAPRLEARETVGKQAGLTLP